MWSVWRLTGRNDSVMVDLAIHRQAPTSVGVSFYNGNRETAMAGGDSMQIVDIIMISFFLFISIALFIVSCVAKYRIKKGCSVEVEAVIEDYSKHHSYSSNHAYHMNVYGYNYKGTHYTIAAKSRWGVSEIGSKQMIVIDPSNPQHYYRKEDLLIPRILFWISIGMIGISIITCFGV